METEAQLMARFIGGLRLPIQDKVSMQHVFTITEAVSLATRAEKQLERSRVSTWEWNPGDSGRTTQNRGKQPVVSSGTTQPSVPGGKTTGGSSSGQRQLVTIPTPNDLYTRPGPKKCFRCNQPGHRSNQCPKRQMINLIEAGGEAEDGEDVEAVTCPDMKPQKPSLMKGFIFTIFSDPTGAISPKTREPSTEAQYFSHSLHCQPTSL
jgi:hypothetical protein